MHRYCDNIEFYKLSLEAHLTEHGGEEEFGLILLHVNIDYSR